MAIEIKCIQSSKITLTELIFTYNIRAKMGAISNLEIKIKAFKIALG